MLSKECVLNLRQAEDKREKIYGTPPREPILGNIKQVGFWLSSNTYNNYLFFGLAKIYSRAGQFFVRKVLIVPLKLFSFIFIGLKYNITQTNLNIQFIFISPR